MTTAGFSTTAVLDVGIERLTPRSESFDVLGVVAGLAAVDVDTVGEVFDIDDCVTTLAGIDILVVAMDTEVLFDFAIFGRVVTELVMGFVCELVVVVFEERVEDVCAILATVAASVCVILSFTDSSKLIF